jgi:hypothetical protein
MTFADFNGIQPKLQPVANAPDVTTVALPTLNGPLATALVNARTPVVDNLTSPISTSALSALQGTVLKSQFDALLTQFQQLVGGSGTLTVANDFPVMNEDTTLSGNVLTNDSSTAGSMTITQYVIAGVSGIFAAGTTQQISAIGSITLNADGTYSFTPVANYNGVVPTITYQVTNGTDIKNGNLSITVSAVNDTPQAAADIFSTLQDTPVTVNVLANDSDVDGDVLSITQINGTNVAANGTVAVNNGTVRLNLDKTLTFTPSTGVTGSQSFAYTADDGNGGTATANVSITVVATGGSVTTPVILYIDAVTGPTTGGEPSPTLTSGAGGYLSVFGRNFGNQADLGTLTKVYIGGVEVDNYRYLGPCVTYARTGIQQITVQVGAIGGAAVGTPQPITVVRNGTATSNNNWTFTPSGGRVLFCALGGSDGNAAVNNINKPWRHLQTVQQTGTAGSGQNGAGTIDGVSKTLRAGDQVVIRAGTWADGMGFDNSWFRFRIPENEGTPTKHIHFTAYPGPIGANAIEVVQYVTPTGTPPNATGGSRYRGAFNGANEAYASTTGDYVIISNLKVSGSADSSSDNGFANSQYSSTRWVVVNNEFGPWPSTINSKCAGYSGHAAESLVMGNLIYGLECVGAQETHGIYIDSPPAGSPAANIELAYNWIRSAPGGNGIQVNDNLGTAGANGHQGFKFHHNWIESYAKYGINLGELRTSSALIYDNVVTNGAFAPFRFDFYGGTLDIDIFNNTAYNCDQTSSGSGNSQFLVTHIGAATGTIRCKANLLIAGPQTIAGSSTASSSAGSAPWLTFDQNWFNGYGAIGTSGGSFGGAQGWTTFTSGGTTTDAHALFGDAMVSNAVNNDFTLASGSPVVDAVTVSVPTLTLDFNGVSRPQGGARDIGAFERISTFPFVSVSPTFSGTQRVGSSSSIGTGTWGNGPITQYQYQWFTAATNGGTTTSITGATSNSYTWQLGDFNRYGGCSVTATNAAGSTTVNVFIGTAVLANLNAPVNTTPASITGTGGIGNVLTRVAGVWTPSSGADAAVVTWIWRRNGANISGTANQSTYTQTTSDDSTSIDLMETGTNQWGANTAASSNSVSVPHVVAAPFLVGTAAAFNSTNTTPTVQRTVQAGDVVALWMSAQNNATYNIVITDDMGGVNGDWVDVASTNVDPHKGGWRYRAVASSGTMTVTVNKTGGASFVGTALVIRGCDPAVIESSNGAHNTAKPVSITPTNTTFSKDLIVTGWGGADQRWATTFTLSDTFVASATNATVGLGVQVQSRTTTTTGVQSSMTFNWVAGTSGLDPDSAVGMLVFKGH